MGEPGALTTMTLTYAKFNPSFITTKTWVLALPKPSFTTANIYFIIAQILGTGELLYKFDKRVKESSLQLYF